ncbi:cytochrome P450 [Allocatelliglobosispora scoriae]|uniref:Cytochrome P450 n=1 Tax=Allocatelliglobosispora scoriae TaxID=643052 RepID=A0A841BED0_9ACTN|nr:cytochrome P450 [Allocatelliglobosispora scoriae]MBB5867447.1 cytochrome P450 [Allocatelliglobosispora scoriae]
MTCDDLLSRMVAAVDETVDDPDERLAVLLGLIRPLLVAGNETTTRLLAEAVALLCDRPAEWRRLRADAAHATRVTQEALRWCSPVQQMPRRVTCATLLGGTALPAGATVLVSFASANRDEAVFDRPDRFDPDRADLHRHIAFGHGIHACLGAGLALLQGRIALQTLAARTRRIEVADHEPRYLPGFLLRGRAQLPVRVQR